MTGGASRHLDHPVEILPLIAEGAMPDLDVRAHIDVCDRCADALVALSPLDLRYVAKGIAAELDAPTPGLLERAFSVAGLEPSWARMAGVAPSLQPSWLLASLGVIAVSTALALLPSGDSLRVSPLLVAAPLVAAVMVAFAYGPGADPAYELVATTPTSPALTLLVRLAGVLVVNAAVVGTGVMVVAAVGPGRAAPPAGLAWILPMAAVALLAAVVASRTKPLTGSGVGGAAWLGLVLVVTAGREHPGPLLWGRIPQIVYAAISAAFLVLLLRWSARGIPDPPQLERLS